MKDNFCLNMIQHLRKNEEVMLYGNLLTIEKEEVEAIINFLKEEYQSESLNYPYAIPPFDEQAAFWGAKTIYLATQLLLYRENRLEDLSNLLKSFEGEVSASTILSSDLCLRFLPEIIKELKLIDPEDSLIEILESSLYVWHYSGINYALDIEKLDLETILSNECMQQLYCNRIIQYKNLKLANHNSLNHLILADLGNYSSMFWKELIIEKNE